MTDIRLQRMAQVLVRYSLGIKRGDRLGIVTGPNAAPLVREVVREAIHAGAYPETFVDLPGVREIILSALHWDMVCDLRSGSEIRVDGEVFSKNGEFAI